MNTHKKRIETSNPAIQNEPETVSFIGLKSALNPILSRVKTGWNQFTLAFSFVFVLSFSGSAQSFQIATDVCDSISPTSYFVHLSGYAIFNDSITMSVELLTNDSIPTIVYSASKDFGVNGTNTLTNFMYDVADQSFTLEIGTYATREYAIRLRSWVEGEIMEELILDL